MKSLNLVKIKNKLHAEAADIHANNESEQESVKMIKEIHASFTVAHQTAKVTAAVYDKHLVQTEKPLNIWEGDMSRKHIPNDGSNLLHQKVLSLQKTSAWKTLKQVTSNTG